MEIDNHIGCAMSGLIADARTLVEHARVETQVSFLFISFFPLASKDIFYVIDCFSFLLYRTTDSPMVSQ